MERDSRTGRRVDVERLVADEVSGGDLVNPLFDIPDVRGEPLCFFAKSFRELCTCLLSLASVAVDDHKAHIVGRHLDQFDGFLYRVCRSLAALARRRPLRAS